MTPIPMPRVVAMARHPSLTFAGFAIGLHLDGIDCMIIVPRESDIQPLVKAIGFAPNVDMAQVKPVGVMSRDSLEVIG